MQKEFIDFLKSKITILDVISSRVKLRKSGKDWFGLCPFHKEKTGSFKVDPDLGMYYCFGCGAHGDIITFTKDIAKISFQEAVEQLADSFGIQLPQKEKNYTDPNRRVYEAIDMMKNWFMTQLNESVGKEAKSYIESRKITAESIKKFHIGYAPDNNNLLQYLKKNGFQESILLRTGVYNKSRYNNELINRYNSRLIFPILDANGRCVGFGGRVINKSDVAKYINSPETEIFIKSNNLYGYNLARSGKSREIILTEGYLDVVSMHQAGFDGAVAPLGTAISENQINMCWKICESPIIALDGDIAGVKASYRWTDKILLNLQPGKSFKFAKLPQGADPDMLIAENKVDVIKDAVRNSILLSDWIWEGAFLLYPSDTPEQKAAIIKMLINKIETIKDNSIKKLYFQEVRKKEHALYRKKGMIITKKENISPVISVSEKLEKIFIVSIINHPYIMDKVAEDLVKIEFDNFQMLELKNRILDCFFKRLDEPEKYVSDIKELGSKVSEIEKDITLHASFTGKDATDEEAIYGWLKLFERYSSAPLMVEDLQTASSSLKSTFSENDWQRLKALKKDIILNRVKRQET